MKKLLTKIAALAIAAVSLFAFTACNGDKQDIGKDYVVATSQLDALTKLDTGAADVAVIDSVMAGYYTATGDYASKMQIVENLVLAEESYGIAAKKGNEALISKINEALIDMKDTGYSMVATAYGLNASTAITAETTNPLANATDSSWDDVVASGKLVVGFTYFAPIAFEAEVLGEEKLVGFDIQLAEMVVAYLNGKYNTNVEIEFLEIDWSTKEAKLEDGTIDLVWNGMTITDERSAAMCISVPYLYNKQVAVINKADAAKYTTVESMKDAIMTAENGSAGESVILGDQE